MYRKTVGAEEWWNWLSFTWGGNDSKTLTKTKGHDNHQIKQNKTNCRIAHLLNILQMISYWFFFYFSDIIVICIVPFWGGRQAFDLIEQILPLKNATTGVAKRSLLCWRVLFAKSYHFDKWLKLKCENFVWNKAWLVKTFKTWSKPCARC